MNRACFWLCSLPTEVVAWYVEGWYELADERMISGTEQAAWFESLED